MGHDFLGEGKKIKLDANVAGDLVGYMMTPGLEVKRFGGIGVSNVHEQNRERFGATPRVSKIFEAHLR